MSRIFFFIISSGITHAGDTHVGPRAFAIDSAKAPSSQLLRVTSAYDGGDDGDDGDVAVRMLVLSSGAESELESNPRSILSVALSEDDVTSQREMRSPQTHWKRAENAMYRRHTATKKTIQMTYISLSYDIEACGSM